MKRKNIGKCRKLRRDQTDAEKKLWSKLRNRQFFDVKFRRQFSINNYILDFYAPEYRLAIEVDGGQHFEGGIQRQDALRTTELVKLGIRVIRFSNLDVLSNLEGVCTIILEIIENIKEGSPSPQSSPQGERK